MIRTSSQEKMHAKQRWYATALCLGTVFGLYTPHAAAQSSENEERGVTLTEHFDVSSSTDGKVLSFTTAAGHNFNKYFGVDAGIPVYIVRASGSVPGSRSSNGMGDAFVDLRLSLDNRWFGYSATLPVTNLQAASQGFNVLWVFVAAVHISDNLGIPFDQLKTAAQTSGNLSNAIHMLKPDADVKAAVREAALQAVDDVEESYWAIALSSSTSM